MKPNAALDCPTAPRLRHRVDVTRRRDHGLRGPCRYCGATVQRTHRGSGTWWVDVRKPRRRPRS